jgi:branched-chain amino acid aminotransferase
MLEFMEDQAYLASVLSRPRPGEGNVLAFYDHRQGALLKNARLMRAPLDDHLLHRSDGVFEVIKFIDRRLYQLEEHLDRLQNSAGAIGLELPGKAPGAAERMSRAELRSLMLAVTAAACASSGQRQGVLRLFLGRGEGGFGVDPAESPDSSLYLVVSRFGYKPESWYAAGLKACRSSFPARSDYFSQVKSMNYLMAVLMTKEAAGRKCDVALCFDEQGNLAESAVANICLVDAEGRLLAPEFTHALPGTTIRRAMKLLEGQVECRLRPLTEQDIFAARELLLLGTSPDCAAIVEYEGRKIGDGKPGRAQGLLRQLIRRDIADNGVQF